MARAYACHSHREICSPEYDPVHSRARSAYNLYKYMGLVYAVSRAGICVCWRELAGVSVYLQAISLPLPGPLSLSVGLDGRGWARSFE